MESSVEYDWWQLKLPNANILYQHANVFNMTVFKTRISEYQEVKILKIRSSILTYPHDFTGNYELVLQKYCEHLDCPSVLSFGG